MKRIIIFGTGSTSKVVKSGLKDDVNIICYCDNDKNKWNKIYEGRKIIEPYKINEMEFDYLLIASQFNESIYKQLLELGIDYNKIFQFFKYVDSHCNYIKNDLNPLIYFRFTKELIITGISYIERAINPDLLLKNSTNLARHSQDLYFGYHLVKYIIDNYKKDLVKLKYVFIGLSYYSFEYDMSLSAMKGKVHLYYEAIGKKHNLLDINEYIKVNKISENIAKNVFNLDKDGYPKVNWFHDESFNYNSNSICNINEEIGKKQALLDGNKNYPETVKENIQIFKDYLKLLKDNNIKPIVIICPVSKYYSKYFPQRLKDEFQNIIKETKKEYDFQIIDCFDSYKLNEDDFFDVSHLNSKGAENFTNMLNKIVEW